MAVPYIPNNQAIEKSGKSKGKYTGHNMQKSKRVWTKRLKTTGKGSLETENKNRQGQGKYRYKKALTMILGMIGSPSKKMKMGNKLPKLIKKQVELSMMTIFWKLFHPGPLSRHQIINAHN